MFQPTETSKKQAHVQFVPLEMTMISDLTQRNGYNDNSELFLDQSSFKPGAEPAPLTNQSSSSYSGQKSRCIARVDCFEDTSAVTSSDPCIIAAFRAVDKIILGKEATYLLRRLAYVQLRRVFTTLEAILRSERKRNQVRRHPRHPRRGDVSVAIDIYMMAQVDGKNSSVSRNQILERRRVSRAWEYLAGPSPLLTLMYSEAADPIVRDLWRKDSASLKPVVTSILKNVTWAVRICARLTHSVVWAVNCGRPSDIREATISEIEQVLSRQVDDEEVYERLKEEDTGDCIESPLRSSTSPNTLTMSSISVPSHWTYPVVEPGSERDDDAVPFGSSRRPSRHLTPPSEHYATKLHFSFASYATAMINDSPRYEGLRQSGKYHCELQRSRQSTEKQKNIINFIHKHLPAFSLRQAAETTSTNSPASVIYQVRVWKTAREQAIGPLMELAYENLIWELVYWVMSEQTFVPIFGDLVRYVYGSCIAEEEGLSHVLAQFAACVVEDICLLDGWHELITEVPSFARNMICHSVGDKDETRMETWELRLLLATHNGWLSDLQEEVKAIREDKTICRKRTRSTSPHAERKRLCEQIEPNELSDTVDCRTTPEMCYSTNTNGSIDALRPKPGEVYSAYHERYQRRLPAVILPLTDPGSIGILGTMETLGFSKNVPNCVAFNVNSRRLEWRDGYRDGEPSSPARKYPVIYFIGRRFPENKAADWVSAGDLQELDEESLRASDAPFYQAVRGYLERRTLCQAFREREPDTALIKFSDLMTVRPFAQELRWLHQMCTSWDQINPVSRWNRVLGQLTLMAVLSCKGA
ncbi:hypothetical protein FPRO05_04924 [Fusarium proliferatum]|uniref:Uncharacterized protein n=1 Tax=Gibberella intermedia TaxID=948311 RepID=A0A365MPE3_GIBIN|nr:hypothetical protein FPRO05_04924 [Fusarium proliferatum]